MGKYKTLSDGSLSSAPQLGWIKLIDNGGNEFDSRKYGVLRTTPRAVYSARTGSAIQIPGREEPLFVQSCMRSQKDISITIGVTDERIAGDVLNAFCRNGKLIISTHPNLYYKAHVLESAVSEGITRRFSEITIPYSVSAYRYQLDEPIIKSGKLAEDGTYTGGIFEFEQQFPYSYEESEPKIYIVTQSGAQADTISADIYADNAERSFNASKLSPAKVYCIDSELMSFYEYGDVSEDGSFSKNDVFRDVTHKTIGDFPVLKGILKHKIVYRGYINSIWVQINKRWNI